MNGVLQLVLIVTLALNFFALGASRVRAVINIVALQGALIGVLPLLAHDLTLRTISLAVGAVAIKAFLIPNLLIYAMREADVRHEVRPLIGFIPGLLLAAIGTGLTMVFAVSLPLAEEHEQSLVIPAALSTVLAGFLMLTTRKMAINQVVGYLVLENGIFIFGMLLLEAMPFLVEIGVLLDLFTGVFVMGIIIYHINREFESTSTEHLSELKE